MQEASQHLPNIYHKKLMVLAIGCTLGGTFRLRAGANANCSGAVKHIRFQCVSLPRLAPNEISFAANGDRRDLFYFLLGPSESPNRIFLRPIVFPFYFFRIFGVPVSAK